MIIRSMWCESHHRTIVNDLIQYECGSRMKQTNDDSKKNIHERAIGHVTQKERQIPISIYLI